MLAVSLTAAMAIIYGFQNQRSAPAAMQDASQGLTLTAALTEGQMDTTITSLGNLTFVIDVRLTAPPDVLQQSDLTPEANFAMVEMHMDGIVPDFSTVGPGVWQAKAVLPMAGAWIVNVGFGEDFAETVFVAG